MDIVMICGIVGALFGALPLLAAIAQYIFNYWTRGEGDELFHLSLLVNTFGIYNYRDADDPEISIPITLILTAFLYTGMGAGVGELIEGGYLWHSVITLGLILSTVFVPRWVLDISKSITYNRKTGNAERIDKLERELEQLRRK